MTRIREKKTACSWFSASLVALLAFCLAIAIVPIPLAIAEDVDEATAAEHVEAVVNDEAAEELGEPEETLAPEELSNVDGSPSATISILARETSSSRVTRRSPS